MSASPTTASASTNCPECEGNVPFVRRPLQGEVVRCPDCNAELEVTGLDPVRLELAPEVQEDWGE
ncbi:MAG: lysine biosynthesis protein LysW [Phycisphaeraceae bacterium]|nr:lysine biosynthesis protein LysW [Phycisphaeraceae bacterium]